MDKMYQMHIGEIETSAFRTNNLNNRMSKNIDGKFFGVIWQP